MPLGSRTRWGKIASVAILSGERYYFMVDKHWKVAMMPAMVVETGRTEEAMKRKAFKPVRAWAVQSKRTGRLAISLNNAPEVHGRASGARIRDDDPDWRVVPVLIVPAPKKRRMKP